MTKPQIRILIVEDDVVDRMACRRSFAQDTHDFEFVLLEAETAGEGLELALTEELDCVLLDYNLPDMNGLEFLTKLRNDQGDVPVPVIMLTGADNVSVAVESIKLGAQDYLVKDPNLQYLELLPSVIQRVLRERLALEEKTLMASSLALAEAKFRFLVEQIPAIIYTTTLDVTGKLIYISPQILQLGFTPDEMLEAPGGFLKQIHPEDQARVYAEIARCHESGEHLRCEYRLLTRAGEVRWFLNEASMVRHDQEAPIFLQGILIDITKDKALADELQQHRRRLEELVANRTIQFEKKTSILESANASLVSQFGECTKSKVALKKYVEQLERFFLNSPCGYLSLDQDGKFLEINDITLGWLGRPREELVGKTKFSDLLKPQSAKAYLDSNNLFKKQDWFRDMELEIVRNDGSKIAVRVSSNAIKDIDGRVVKYLLIIVKIA
jgi:PAS domain S-box-containing protein